MPLRVWNQIRRQAEAGYPNESCGVLVGRGVDGVRTVTDAFPTRNTSSQPRQHYEMDLMEVIRMQKRAREAGDDLLGFYHSHPDSQPRWSPTDLAEAHWLGCSYVITDVHSGRAGETHSFHLLGRGEEDKRFEEERLLILEGGDAPVEEEQQV